MMKKFVLATIIISFLGSFVSCGHGLHETARGLNHAPENTEQEMGTDDMDHQIHVPEENKEQIDGTVENIDPVDETDEDDSQLPLDTVIMFEDPVIEDIARFYFWPYKEDDFTYEDALSIKNLGTREGEFYWSYYDGEGKSISTLNDLRWFKNVEWLYLYNCGLESLEGVEYLKNLTKIHLMENQVKNISPLAKLENLEVINCANNRVSDISVLANHPSLKEINLFNNPITDISPLIGMEKLQAVCVVGTDITSEELNTVISPENNRYIVEESRLTIHETVPEVLIQLIIYLDYFVISSKERYNKCSEYLRVIDTQTGVSINDIKLDEASYCYDFVEIEDIIEFKDINFDGYMDMEVQVCYNGNWHIIYDYFSWDFELGEYKRNHIINELSKHKLLNFNEEKQLIYGMSRGSASDHWHSTYQYIDGTPICIETESRNGVHFPREVEDEQIIEIIPAIGDATYYYLICVVIHQINYETMELEFTKSVYELYIDDKFIAEYDFNSNIGKKIKELAP